jgi:hypothetical protein
MGTVYDLVTKLLRCPQDFTIKLGDFNEEWEPANEEEAQVVNVYADDRTVIIGRHALYDKEKAERK